MTNDLDYTLKYAVINSKEIINLCGPEYNDPSPAFFINSPTEIEKAIRRNINLRSKFYTDLELSIKHVGIRNPILVTGGTPKFKHESLIPEKYMNKNALWCEIQGGSRLYFAQKHDLFIPCIVSDFNNILDDGFVLNNEEEILSIFVDKPKVIKLTKRGLKLSPPPNPEPKDQSATPDQKEKIKKLKDLRFQKATRVKKLM